MTNSEHDQKPLDLVPVRRQSLLKGKEYWRSLNELANREGFEELVKQEFPRQANLLGSLNRRDFIKILGASLALAGLTACAPVTGEKILPYVNPPEQLIPGKPVYFASAFVMDGFARGVLIETTMGRPIKVEGNPKHPGSLGASDVFMQASILELYNPARVQSVSNKGTPKSWTDFTNALGGILGGLGQGAGLRILSGAVTSPTLIDQMNGLLKKYPQAKWVQYSPVMTGNAANGANAAFGQPSDVVYNFSAADVILSLDSDFMMGEPGSVRYSRDFAARHQPISAKGVMSRFYAVESSNTVTGSNADHRLAVKPSQVETFARAIASRLGVNVPAPSGEVPGQSWLDPLAADLKKAGRAALVIAGERQSPAVHALALAMNQALGSVGNTVTIVAPSQAGGGFDGLKGLVADLNGGSVDTLVILDGNPVYASPADINFGDAMKKAKQSIYLAYYPDETSQLATWVVPAAHDMESWGDARAFDGTVSIIQPVIEPLFGGKSIIEMVAALMGKNNAHGYDLVRGFWQGQMTGSGFDNAWKDILSNGVVPNSAAKATFTVPTVNASAFSAAPKAAQGMEIVFEPDPTIWDGRFFYNSWLQELPKPVTKLTWDNAVIVSPATAQKLGLSSGAANGNATDNFAVDVVTIKLKGRSVDAPVYIEPGSPDDVLIVSLGYGHKVGGTTLGGSQYDPFNPDIPQIPPGGSAFEGAGFNANSLRSSDAPWFDSGVEISKTGRTYDLATTHEHWTMENRDLIRDATLPEYQQNPKFAQTGEIANRPTLYEPYPYNGYAWAMSINLSACIGCNACVIACQAENNSPSVGKDQVLRSREMHWLRIDRYYQGSAEHPRFAYQPVPCMHCEKAPCEPVCPVEATSHSAEGINEMTYNRCVGTRYCSNNCPYKVRRFNFYLYTDYQTELLKAMHNPDVTVRMRGVMEKCTYCIQRITQARIQSEVEGRKIADGEVKTACQQACPTNAIVFGDKNDQNSAVSKLRALPLNYGLLAELGTEPRTTYLAKVRNPNPSIPEA